MAAATVIAELGDITRFYNPSQLMTYLRLVPSERSRGPTRRKSDVTQYLEEARVRGIDRGMLQTQHSRIGLKNI